MGSTDEDIFTTAPSQHYYPGLHNEIQIEQHLREAYAVVNKVVEDNNAMAILGAKPFLAQPAGPQCSATQVEPRVFAWEIQLHLAAAQEALSRAMNVLESKWELRHVSEAGLLNAHRIVQHVSGAEIEELATALAEVSLEKPDTRLVIAYPHEHPDGDSFLPGEQMLSRKDVLGVIQSKEDVDYTFKLPITKNNMKIVYQPMSDICLLFLEKVDSTDFIYITNLDSWKKPLENLAQPAAWMALRPSEAVELEPGLWRILLSNPMENYSSAIDILVLQRSFNVSIQNTKRQATDHIVRTRSAKRRKLGTPGKNNEAAKAPSFNNDDHITQMSQNTATLQDLQEGHTVIIETQAKREETYSLQVKHNLGKTPAAHVLSCRHSKMARGMIAVKILLQNSGNFNTIANCWKREKTTLEKLNHDSIVELRSFDGRMLLIGLEPLPPSLRVILDDEKHPSFRSFLQPSEALRILQDLSSALAYLSTKDIVHNDIKPDNIAYSPDRGPVLFDFGLATSSSTKKVGGTHCYVPPEYLVNESRGIAGDMWALGITMLYILGHISLPETTGKPWYFPRSRTSRVDRDRMELWLRRIASKRHELCLQESYSAVGLVAVQSLVAQMLHERAGLRIKAAELHAAAMEIDLPDLRLATC